MASAWAPRRPLPRRPPAPRLRPSARCALDYFHTGNTTQELFALDHVVIEPAAWSGVPGRDDDPLQLGAYGFDVRDAGTTALLYSRGFGSIYEEWVTTEEAATITRTFHESLRFPAPRMRRMTRAATLKKCVRLRQSISASARRR